MPLNQDSDIPLTILSNIDDNILDGTQNEKLQALNCSETNYSILDNENVSVKRETVFSIKAVLKSVLNHTNM